MAKLTIGLPVYNGAAHLARSIEHLLAQTFTDFVLILNDNASTDTTAEICADFARRDSRICYFRNPETVHWNENFRIVLERADSPYFMWATYDDIWLPRFAEENIALLEQHPNACCAVSKIIYFRNDGYRITAPDNGPLTGAPAERIQTFLRLMHNCGRLYGVYRTETLRASFPKGLRVYGTDWLVVALTLLRGDHLEVNEVLLEREANRIGHYIHRFGRTDDFSPTWLDWLVPLRRFNREMRSRLPKPVWKKIRPALVYLNLRQCALMLETRLPVVRSLIRPLRKTTAMLFHRRWRTERSKSVETDHVS
jgi:glycosyltransferase involved in cell wall biosynthesis